MAKFWANRSARRVASDETGFTLVELMIAMFIFGVFVTVLIASITGISRAAARAQVVARTSSSVLAVFQDIDHQVRYADSVNFPGSGVSGARYVEYRIPASSSSTGVTTCGQWRYTPSTGKLDFRSWQDIASPVPTAWVTKLTGVKGSVTSTYPFQLIPASLSGAANQQFVLTLDAGSAAFTQGAAISSRFLARNSSTLSQSNAQSVTAGVSDTPVCPISAVRP
jgi:prepilin-type N-terminal cleavage/methylation domain-containing protein